MAPMTSAAMTNLTVMNVAGLIPTTTVFTMAKLVPQMTQMPTSPRSAQSCGESFTPILSSPAALT